MWAALGGLLGGLFSAGGTLGGAAIGAASSDKAARLQYKAQQATNEQNYKIWRENVDWQTQMANTAHQREVADLRSAGLNPILSATGGSGAPVPNVASPTMVSPGSSVADKSALYMSMVSDLMKSVNSASSIAQTISQVELNYAHKQNVDARTALEVGKGNPYQIAVNALEKHGSSAKDFAGGLGGLLTDIMRGVRSQVKYIQQNYQYQNQRGNLNPNGVHDFGFGEANKYLNLESLGK